MGIAKDTVLYSKVNPGAAATAFATTASGDPASVRNFAATDMAYLEGMIRRGATSGMARVRSPLLADNVSGIQFFTGETPSVFMLPPEVSQRLQAQDQPIVEGTGGTAETDLIALVIYYTNLLGASARLHSLPDITPLVKNIKALRVAVTSSATIGAWSDTLITASETTLDANTDYAVLGYVTDVALGLVGVKGQDTANLRICGPGTTLAEDTADYFVRLDRLSGRPQIPVVNSANQGALYVSVADSAASTAANITLVLAQLSQNLPN